MVKRINGVMSEASDWKREVSSHAFVHTGQCIRFQALLQPGKPQMWVQKGTPVETNTPAVQCSVDDTEETAHS